MADEQSTPIAVQYRPVVVKRGNGGWGSQLIIRPTARRNRIVSVTGGGIHQVAARIAELTGCEAVDGFHTRVPEEQMACVVIDCGGTARIGVYPRMGVLTIDVLPSGPSGPLAQFIKETNFVSGVTPADVSLTEEPVAAAQAAATAAPAQAAPARPAGPSMTPSPTGGFAEAQAMAAARGVGAGTGGRRSFLVAVGQFLGYVVATLFQSGREAVDMMIKNIIPFMAFVGLLMGIITYTGLGHLLAVVVTPLAGTIWGLGAIVIIGTFPFFSPILGPGAVIAQIVGVFVGTQIAAGVIPPQYALPALFAIDGQVGCDFVPVGLALGEAEPATVEDGVPAVLFSRQITGLVAVILAYFLSFGTFATTATK